MSGTSAHIIGPQAQVVSADSLGYVKKQLSDASFDSDFSTMRGMNSRPAQCGYHRSKRSHREKIASTLAMQHSMAVRAHHSEVFGSCLGDARALRKRRLMVGFDEIRAEIPVSGQKVESAHLAEQSAIPKSLFKRARRVVSVCV